MGYAEGGLVAFYAAAIDTRIEAVLVSGYFDSRERVWAEPIYHNVWSLLQRFGDAEVASLILPRRLIVEHAPVPKVSGHKGDWQTPEDHSVASEFDRIPVPQGFPRPVLVAGEAGQPIGPGSEPALQAFSRQLGVVQPWQPPEEPPRDNRVHFDPTTRQRDTVRHLEGHVQNLVRASEHVRDRFKRQ